MMYQAQLTPRQRVSDMVFAPFNIEFGEYLPDLGFLDNPGVTDAKKVLPGMLAYDVFYRTAAYSSNAIDTTVALGAASFVSTAGTPFNFVGNATKIYSLTGGTAFDDVSRTAGGAYAPAAGEQWYFTSYGNLVIATDYTDVIQSYTMGSSTDFAALSGSPPKARYLAQSGNHVMLGNINDGSALPFSVQWCKIGDPLTWSTSIADQSGIQALPSSKGAVQQIVGGEYFTIFQEKGITRALYVGGDKMYQFDGVIGSIGTKAPGSVVTTPVGIFYLGTDGFRIFDGANCIPIGVNKVDRTWADVINANSTYNLAGVRSVVDPYKPIVYVCCPTAGGTDAVILAYNYSPNATKRWTYIQSSASDLFQAYAGFVLKDVNNKEYFAVVSTDNSNTNAGFVRTFTSSTEMTCNIVTGWQQIKPGKIVEIIAMMPLVEGATGGTASITSSTNVSYALGLPALGTTTLGAFSMDSRGIIYPRSNGLYHSINGIMSGDYTKFWGFQVLEYTETALR